MAVVRGHSPGTVYATERGGTGQCFLPLRGCTNVHGGDAGEDVEGIPDDPTVTRVTTPWFWLKIFLSVVYTLFIL